MTRKIVPMSQMTDNDRAEIAKVMKEAHIEQTAKVLNIPRDRIRADVRWEESGGLGVMTYVDDVEFDFNSEDGIRIIEAIHEALGITRDPTRMN